MFETGKTQADIDAETAKQEQETLNRESRQYLTDTDWYVIRQQETGEAIPEEISILRREARGKVLEV